MTTCSQRKHGEHLAGDANITWARKAWSHNKTAQSSPFHLPCVGLVRGQPILRASVGDWMPKPFSGHVAINTDGHMGALKTRRSTMWYEYVVPLKMASINYDGR